MYQNEINCYKAQLKTLNENVNAFYSQLIPIKYQSLSSLNEFNQLEQINKSYSQLQNTIRQLEEDKACLNEQIKSSFKTTKHC